MVASGIPVDPQPQTVREKSPVDVQESDLDDGAASLPDDEPGSWVQGF